MKINKQEINELPRRTELRNSRAFTEAPNNSTILEFLHIDANEARCCPEGDTNSVQK